jgi:hypothetical protein
MGHASQSSTILTTPSLLLLLLLLYRGCYEIKCVHKSFKDGYGETINRDGVCRDTDASVVVRTTDTCPCQYPGNYASNKRWCCGDKDHFDISVHTFEKVGGVVAQPCGPSTYVNRPQVLLLSSMPLLSLLFAAALLLLCPGCCALAAVHWLL